MCGRNGRSLKKLLTRDTELMAMAAEAIMGFRRSPQKRYKNPRGDGDPQDFVE